MIFEGHSYVVYQYQVRFTTITVPVQVFDMHYYLIHVPGMRYMQDEPRGSCSAITDETLPRHV